MSEVIDIDPANPTQQTMALAQRPENQAVGMVRQETYADLMALAKELCTTGFLPQAVKTPAQAVAIIMTGRELGLGPMQSLRSICIIQGKPELAADLQLSIFHRDGGRSKWLALTEQKAALWLRHPNGDEHTETFTIEDARRAGLAGGQNWIKYPKAMLRSRAITAGLKSVGFEPLAGAYAPGEIGGPEIVGPEPETIPETTETVIKNEKTAAFDRRASGGVSTPTPRAQSAGNVATPSATVPQKASSDVKPWPLTEKNREWLISKKLDTPEVGLPIAIEYFQKAGILLPTEAITDLPLHWLPTSAAEVAALLKAIVAFGGGAEARKPYEPHEIVSTANTPAAAATAAAPSEFKKAATAAVEAAAPGTPPKPEPPAALEAAKKKDPEWWRAIVVPIPPRGMRRAEYMQNPQTVGWLYDNRHDEAVAKRLFGFISHFEVEKTWVNEQGQTKNRSASQIEADEIFREALDACDDYAKKHHGDTEPAPEESTPFD